MKRISLIFLVLFPLFAIGQQKKLSEERSIGKQLNLWHQAAAEANFENYFSLMTTDAIFIGTDPSERWSFNEFKAYAKPHFDKGKAWSFTPIKRSIKLAEGNKIAWFDELLKTQMGVCRGSGIVRNENGI